MRILFYLARENLNEVRFQGKKLRVSTSKHDNINMPKRDSEVVYKHESYSLFDMYQLLY